MQERKEKVCLKDIAQEVGVSVALVSYVLNNRFENRINKTVAGKIRDTAARLRYQPNQIAKSLKTNKTNTIGLVVANISDPFSSMVARILEDEGAKHGYTVVYGSSDEDLIKFERLTNAFLTRQVDGLILLPPEGSEELILGLKNRHFPFVIMDRYFKDIEAHYVSINNFKASYDAVQLFISNGKKRIGIINYNTTLEHLKDRTKGYKQALADAGIDFQANWHKQVGMGNNPDEIILVAKALIADAQVDAILFASNRIGVHSLKYIIQHQIAVPQAVALISFDESEVFDFYQPQITYIQQPMMQLGQMTIKLLMEIIAQDADEQIMYIPAEIVQRGSTAAKN